MAPGSPVPRFRVRRGTVALTLFALLVLLAAPFLLLRLAPVRQLLLESALRRTGESTGLSLRAKSLDVEPLRGLVRLHGLVVSVPGAPPFLTLETADADLDLGALARRRLHFRRLSLRGLRVDLGAPLPAPKEKSGPSFLSSLDVDALDLEITSLVSDPLPPAMRRIALGTRIDGARLSGSLRRGALLLRGDVPAIRVDREGRTLALAGGFSLALSPDERFRLEELRLVGDGLSLSASGTGALSPDAPLALHAEVRATAGTVAPELGTNGTFTLVADVEGSAAAPSAALVVGGQDVATRDVRLSSVSAKARLLPEAFVVEEAVANLLPGGRIEGTGRFERASGEGVWNARAERLPEALLAGFLDGPARARLGLAESELDGTFTIRHGGSEPTPLSVDSEVSLRRGAPALAKATVRLSARDRATVEISALLLPASAGERIVRGRIEAASLPDLASGRLVDGLFHAAGPDLASALAELRSLFPALVPGTPAGLALDGPFRLDLRAAGPLRAAKGEVDATFRPARGGALSLRATADAARRSVEGEVRADGLSLGTFRRGSTGLASGDARFSFGPTRTDLRATLDASGLCLAEELPLVESLHASLEADRSELRLFELAAAAGEGTADDGTGGTRLAASGRASIESPWRDADLDASVSVGALSAALRAVARDGHLAVDVPRAGARGFEAILAARLPLGALGTFPAFAGVLPPDLPAGPLEVTIDAPGLDSCALEGLLPAGTPLLPLVADLRAFATFDLADPLGGSAGIAIEGVAAETAAGRLALSGPARVTLGGGRIALEEVTVEGARTSFSAALSADLLPDARLGGPLSALVSSLTASARGRADAALLAPFLAGGAASGEITLDARAAGPPGALAGSVFLDGSASRFSWPVAWPTEVRSPTLSAALTPGSISLTRGDAFLNGGPLLLAGGWQRDEGIALTATFSDVRYRLAYGLAAVLSGELTLRAKGDRRKVSGEVTLDRGLLEKDVDLDREILARILAPPEAVGTEASLLDTLELEVGVGTAAGVRIRNNVADLSAAWSRLDVTGTARRPVVRGRIDVESGGLVHAYGQTFRIDRGTVTYAGDPATDPRLEFVTTSSLQDRSIGGRTAAGDVFAQATPSKATGQGEVDAAAELARGLAGYYGDRLASRLGSALGPVSLSVQPLFLLGETDQAARLTLSRAFSPGVSLAVSIDLKNAQRQTWVVDVHGIRGLPPLAAQVFTEDYGRFGGSLQQRIELGGSRIRGEEPDAPRLSALTVIPPEGVRRRALVSALGLRRGDPVGRSRLFEARIDAEAFLRDRGWPEAQVTLRSSSAKKAGRVDVEAEIDLGPRVEIAFEGDPLPAASRASIAGLYRTGTLEASSLEEMRLEALRAFRALGHLAPEVAVTAGGDDARRRVVVKARAGRKVEIRQVAFEGVASREAGVLARRFTSALERTELLASFPSADRRLREALLGLGYPAGRILDRALEEGGRLVVRVDPGPPSLVASVEVRGVPADEAGRLSRLAIVAPGDPADADRTALSALAIENTLREGGFASARVRTSLSPASPEDPPRLAVVFDVAKGPAETVGTVSFEGLSRTSPSLARHVAGLPPGSSFRREEVDRARGELFALGLFRSVRGEAVPGPDGRVDVVLKAEELPPLTVAYGLRWENERGLAAVLDVADRNVLGRGLTLGTRILYDPDDRAIRAFAGVPERILGLGLDVWVERRRYFRPGLYLDSQTDSTEASIQLSRSLGSSLSARLYGKWKETRYFEDDPFFPLDVTTTFPYLGTQLVWDTREDPLLGTRGLLASVDLQGSGSWLSSDFSYARVYGQVNVYHPVFAFGAGRAVWAQSARAGYARAFDGQELIPDVRFYAGGSYSVRGYPTESLGPQEDLGGSLFATGGSTLLVINEELRVPLHPRLLGVAFFDAGQAWASSRDFGTGLATSVGLGVRALTPLGVLRLDGALPLNRREGDPPWKVTFGFGNVF